LRSAGSRRRPLRTAWRWWQMPRELKEFIAIEFSILVRIKLHRMLD
jgi:hypothetical protein